MVAWNVVLLHRWSRESRYLPPCVSTHNSRRVYRCISWLDTSQLPPEELKRARDQRGRERDEPHQPGGGNHSTRAYFKDSWFIHVFSMNKWAAAVNAARYWSPGGLKPAPYINRVTFCSVGGRRSTGKGVCLRQPRVILTLTSVSFIFCSSKVRVHLFLVIFFKLYV